MKANNVGVTILREQEIVDLVYDVIAFQIQMAIREPVSEQKKKVYIWNCVVCFTYAQHFVDDLRNFLMHCLINILCFVEECDSGCQCIRDETEFNSAYPNYNGKTPVSVKHPCKR